MAAIAIDDLTRSVVALLGACGVGAADAEDTAAALVTTDAMGVFTHGTKLLAGYVRKLRGGGYDPAGRPAVEREGPAWAIVDGRAALGQVGSTFAVRLAIAKARQCGTAYVGLRGTGHIGAAGYYAALAAREGFVALVTGNDIPSVAAPGSRRAVLGSNPLAWAAPLAGGEPLLLDIATAAVAGGKVYAARQRGEPIPTTWLVGADGRPTADAALYPKQAALAPMAGHKGYGLGLLCEVLSAVLPGGHVTWQVGDWIFDEPSRPSWHNAAFTLIDAAAVAGPEFGERLAALAAEIRSAPPALEDEPVRLPGEREWQALARARREGIALPPDVVAALFTAADLAGVALPAEWR